MVVVVVFILGDWVVGGELGFLGVFSPNILMASFSLSVLLFLSKTHSSGSSVYLSLLWCCCGTVVFLVGFHFSSILCTTVARILMHSCRFVSWWFSLTSDSIFVASAVGLMWCFFCRHFAVFVCIVFWRRYLISCGTRVAGFL